MTGPDCAGIMRNSIHAHKVVPYAAYLYTREPQKVLFALDGGGLKVVEAVTCSRRVQEGCNMGPLFSSADSLKIVIIS